MNDLSTNHLSFFKRNNTKLIKTKNDYPTKKEGINEQVINNYNLKGNITIKNMNNISIENVMVHSSQGEKKRRLSLVLLTEPSEDYTKLPLWSPTKMKVNNIKSMLVSKDNKDIHQRQSSLKGINKMITHLRDEFNELNKKKKDSLIDNIEVLGDGLELRHGIINTCIDNNTSNDIKNIRSKNKNKDKDRPKVMDNDICSINSLVDQIDVDSNNDDGSIDDFHCNTHSNFLKGDNINFFKNNHSKIHKKIHFLNVAHNTNINNPQLLLKQNTQKILKPQTSMLSNYENSNVNKRRQRNKQNSNMKNFGLSDTFSNTIININPLNQQCSSSFNCINKQITFSIRSARTNTANTYNNNEKEKKMETVIKALQSKISDLEIIIKTLNTYIKTQEDVFLRECQSFITKNVQRQQNALLSKEREINKYVIKENKSYKTMIMTIIYSLCRFMDKDKKYKDKEDKIIRQLVKENQYLRGLNGSFRHVLLRSYRTIDHKTVIKERPALKKSSNKLTKGIYHNDYQLNEEVSENEGITRDPLNLSTIVNKNLEETIKKLAECKTITEIEKITTTVNKKK